MNERRSPKSAPTAAEPPSPDGLATPSSPSVTNETNLPPIAADADDLKAIKTAVDDAAGVGGGLWLSYLFVLFYLAVAAGAVTHKDLFFENPVKLPFLTIELPLLAFFFLAPILFIVVRAYTLVHLVFLTDKAKRYHQALHDPERNVTDVARENLQWQLPSNIFIQFLAGPPIVRNSAFGWLLRAIAWVTLEIAPVLLLLLMQIQFLPFHSLFVTWVQRIALGLDLALTWWLWGKILSGREVDRERRLTARLLLSLGLALSLVVLLFSVTVVTFPGEWQEDHLPSAKILPALAGWGEALSLHDWLFNEEPGSVNRRRLPFSSTLVLTGLNVYEGLGIDDPEKAKWHDFVFRARGRDLKGAIFDLANLPKVDFEGAQLEGAHFYGAQLQGASFHDAQLQGATLQGAQLQGASLDSASLDGAWLIDANLEGASLNSTKLRGASLWSTQLQGTLLDAADLQGASMWFAHLEGASLDGADLQGASLAGAQLQGASLQGASLHATSLSKALLWRTNRAADPRIEIVEPVAVTLPDSPDSWLPSWRDIRGNVQPWNEKAYQDLRLSIETVPPGGLRDQALDRIRRLDCASPDKTLASCEPPSSWIPPFAPPPEAAKWRKALEDAHVDGPAYATALAAALKPLVCTGDDDAIYVLRGVIRGLGRHPPSRLLSAGPEAPALVDFIMSKDCPVSASLTDDDRAKLLRIKRDAIKGAGQ